MNFEDILLKKRHECICTECKNIFLSNRIPVPRIKKCLFAKIKAVKNGKKNLSHQVLACKSDYKSSIPCPKCKSKKVVLISILD